MTSIPGKRYATAYFVRHPRTVQELMRLHLLDKEKPFIIVEKICLSRRGYENFLADMTVDRCFIEDNAAKCKSGDVRQCLFVYCRDPRTGILVVPAKGGWVGEAAYYCEN